MIYFRKIQRLFPLFYEVIEPELSIDLGQHVTFPDGYRPLNPSVVRYGQNLLVCVRGAAYVVDKRLGFVANPDDLPSLNRLLFLRNDLTYAGRPPLPLERLDNLEDLKLFIRAGSLLGVGSLPVADPRNANACVIVLVEFNAGLTDCRLIPLSSPFDFPLEKNWAPFVANGVLHFVYSCQPLVLLQYDPVTTSVDFVGQQRPSRLALKFLEGGSSGGIPTPSGTLFLTHRRVVRLPSRQRIYLTRIRHLSKDLMNFTAGTFFFIGLPGEGIFRFANGMVLDQDRVLITYGETDSAAWLACLSRERLQRAVFPRT